MKTNTIFYGLIAGMFVTIIMVIGMASIYDTDSKGSMVLGFTTMLVAFSLIFVNIKAYRDKNGGVISFGKAFGIGLSISLIASSMYVLAWMVEYYVFFPDFYDKCEIHQVAKLKSAGAALSEIKAKTQQYEQAKQFAKKPIVHALATYVEILPVGLLVSLIAALILKRKSGGENAPFASQVSQ